MIAIKLQGRLGNQLFQYAFAYATSKKLKTTFYLDRRLETFFLPKYFHQTKDFLYILDITIFTIQGFNNFFSTYLRLKLYSGIKKILRLEEVSISDQINPSLEAFKLKDKKIYDGYFQSEQYFSSYKQEIIAKFSIKKKFQTEFQRHFESLPQGYHYVVIHVRRADYIHYNVELSRDYYHAAIAKIIADQNFYIIISDDISFVEEEFAYLKNKYISKASEIIDFQYLMNADVCIISNSTFSWWGAYLNKKNAKIIAPNKWFNESGYIESPCAIILDTWDLIHF